MADASSAAPTVNVDHLLVLELSSLRAAVSRYQHEAHATSLKLQRHSLETSQAIDHARALERENARLKEEVAVLRANPDTNPTQATFQVPELTLALRRLSDKLTAVEETLLARTEEAIDTRSELANAQNEIEAARALAADARAREEEGLARERDLARRLKAADEERRMADLVVQEYADLVRKLEGRARVPSDSSSTSSVDLSGPNNGSTATLVDSLAEGKSGLQRLLEEFNGQNEHLEAEIAKLHGDNGLLYKELEVARLGAEHDRLELAKVQHELDTYHADDSTAVKMVSRYMKFSQSSTDTLQRAMDALRARHSATIATFNTELTHLQRVVERERTESDRVRSALDELTEDIAREAFGRRREISLRLAFLGREENLAESLRRWIRRTRESLERSSGSSGDDELDAVLLRDNFARAVLDAEGLLETLNHQPSVEDEQGYCGSIARLILAQDAVSSLTHELQEETVRRLKTERKLARLETPDHPEDILAQRETKPMAHPVPHRANVAMPEQSLAECDSSPPASFIPSPVLREGRASADEVSPADVIIDEIVIAPSLDPFERQSHERRSESSVASSLAPGEPHTHEPATQDTLNPPHTPDIPDTTSNPTIPPRNTDTAVGSPAGPLPPPPETVVQRLDDSLPVLFPSRSDSPPFAPASDGPSHHASSQSSVPSPSVSSVPTPAVLQVTSRAAIPPPLLLDAMDGSTLSPLPSDPVSPARPTGVSKEASLLANLAKVKHRYDDVQRGFRDCHLALKELKKSLSDLPPPPTVSASDMHTLLQKAVDRLGDFNEDARVELEIRIADEERIASGYEALLSIPGALAHADDVENVDANEMLKEVRAFVDGTDRVVGKATHAFAQKLDDLEHDIASIKRTLHELALASSEDPLLSAPASSARTTTSPKWSAWTPSFLSPPRATSPAPTFGSVMTSPRLRHSSSFTRPRDSPVESPVDPLSGLGLRIAVPSPVRSPVYGGLGVGAGAGAGGPQRAGPRQRTTSGMFMLGLGMRSTSFGSGMSVQTGASASRTSSASGAPSTSRLGLTTTSPKRPDSDGEGDEECVDSDVE
ncbi:hypothetical protein C2E23DRAFT_825296 [Lenzites betulinus]|nr:hypothetical protein C2E23DRAFT_825296 [Lenzites betulinus]